jgi:plasmid stabilization system protein ParE
MSLQFHPDARDELQAAIYFYGAASERFADAVEKAIESIIDKPNQFREIEHGTQVRRVVKFPYSILYSVKDHNILILAVKHDRRAPDYWHYRRNL